MRRQLFYDTESCVTASLRADGELWRHFRIRRGTIESERQKGFLEVPRIGRKHCTSFPRVSLWLNKSSLRFTCCPYVQKRVSENMQCAFYIKAIIIISSSVTCTNAAITRVISLKGVDE